MRRLIIFTVATFAAAPLAAQRADVAAQLSGRVPAVVVQAAQSLAESAAVAGVPSSLLVQKALEGAAKNIPADRVITALQTLFGRELTALDALQKGGISTPDAADVEGATFALGAGLSGSDVSALARAGGTTYAAATTMRVAGTLAAMGVSAAGTVRLVSSALAAGMAPGDLGTLPASIESGVAHGMTPAQAAEGLARAAQSRRSSPSGRGRPGIHPQAP